MSSDASGSDQAAGAPPVAAGAVEESAGVELEFQHVFKRYAGSDEYAINDLTFTVPAGNICCLVGPSGGGKTTAMMLVNRLIDITDGDILIGGKSVYSTEVTALRRDIGYVIQEIGLFPHMTIGGNIGVVPKLLGWSRSAIDKRVPQLLELVQLDPGYAKRYPAQLSGGQQQRIGLARALAVDPPVMLMDEPFGALDPITRSGVQDEFLRLQREIQKTVIFVTHDIDEAIKMGDRIAVLRQGGVLAQFGTAEDLLVHPVDDYVADFVGADRGLKALSLRRMRDIVKPGSAPSNADELPSMLGSDTVRNGLSRLFTTGAEQLVVRDADGTVLGAVAVDELRQAAGTTDDTDDDAGPKHEAADTQ
jgi:osmoprotectant transport system ATP-binding protein